VTKAAGKFLGILRIFLKTPNPQVILLSVLRNTCGFVSAAKSAGIK
jgi:hypothetical protein